MIFRETAVRQYDRVCNCLLSLIVFGSAVRPLLALAGDKSLAPPTLRLDLEEWTRAGNDTTAVERSAPLGVFFGRSLAMRLPSEKVHLDVAPLFDDFVALIRDAGIPLRAVQVPGSERRLGVSASFNLGEGLPALAFHVGQSMPELFGAFSTAHSFSWGAIWPMHQFTLRLEGGSHSEFGYFAIAGAQWSAASRPLAIGIGVPIALRNANGQTGVLVQFRMKFH